MITYRLERWSDLVRDAGTTLFPLHWEELALDRAMFPLDVNHERFEFIDQSGMLHIVTARDGERIVGYYMAIIMPHLHYKSAGLMAFTDMYFLHPDYRKGGNGVAFLLEIERSLKERGVVKAYLSCKVHQDHGPLFEGLGWRFSDKSYCKTFVGKDS